ncbi:MAG: EAL domain-containing protein [Acetivibrio ethanolgignens]
MIQEAIDSEEKCIFIRSVIFVCHQFDKTVCVEGIEQEEQDDIIRTIGCDLKQGFCCFFGPMELSDIFRLSSCLL